jgi:preprotein translocase subunit SecB
MADTQPTQQQPVPPLLVNGQYIKDLSFEIPNAPGIFAELANGQPDLNVQVNVNTDLVRDNTFEVVLRLSVDATMNKRTCFIVDASYAGLFTLNVAPEHVQPVLLIECPRLLFPFARNIIADVTRDGGFPPVILQPIDFAGLYQARLQQQAGDPNASATATASSTNGGAPKSGKA